MVLEMCFSPSNVYRVSKASLKELSSFSPFGDYHFRSWRGGGNAALLRCWIIVRKAKKPHGYPSTYYKGLPL